MTIASSPPTDLESVKPFNIAFLGNCQTISLCMLMSELCKKNPKYKAFNCEWCCYSREDLLHYDCEWSSSCAKRTDDSDIIEYLKNCDCLVFQNILEVTSPLFHTNALLSYLKPECRIISMSSIHLDINNLEESLDELKRRDDYSMNVINVSEIIGEYINKNVPSDLMLTINHPTTLLFFKILEIICRILNIDFYSKEETEYYISNRNHIGLPM